MSADSPEVTFELPPELAATEPPEARGLRRDGVRLLVADTTSIRHTRFHDLGRFLAPGDLVVVNTSATLNAAVDGRRGAGRRSGQPVTVHFSTVLDDGMWLVELRSFPGGAGRVLDGVPGERIELPDGATLTLVTAHPDPGQERSRIWRGHVSVEGRVTAFLNRVGRPISYGYVHGRWPLDAYQTVFARHPGSAEMPSAGRPFTSELVTSLVSAGVAVAPITLHTGVSSLERGETPMAERFEVSPVTAEMVAATRRRGGRVVAVGTTVARALETVTVADGTIRAGQGWTELVLGPDRPARVVTGLLTGLHEADASHLLLLEAVAGRELVRRAYAAAMARRYLWHEFGDVTLLLP